MSIQSNNPVNTLRSEIKKAIKYGLVLLIVMTFIFNVFSLALPLYSLQIFDRVLSSKSIQTLIMLLVLILICIITMTFMDALRRRIPSTIIRSIYNIINIDFIENTKTDNKNEPPLKLFSLINDFSDRINNPVLYSIFDVLFSPIFLLLTYFIHPVFFTFLLTINSLILALTIFKSSNLNKLKGSLSTKINNKVAIDKQCNQNFQNLNNLSYLHTNFETFIENKKESSRLDQIKNNNINQYVSIFSLIKHLALVGTPTIGAILLISNEISIGQFLFASIISMKSVISFEQIGQHLHYIHQLNDSYKNLTSFLKSIHFEELGNTQSQSLENITLLENSEFKNTSDIKFKKSDSFGVVCDHSADGSEFISQIGGKITDSSKVLWNGLPPNIYSIQSYNKLVGYCDSQHNIFQSRIIDIICPNEVDQFRLNECIDRLDLTDEIMNFKDRLNHTILETDHVDPDFIQRLFIARAIYHDPDLIIFNRVDLFLNQKGLSIFLNLINSLKKENKFLFILSDRKSIVHSMNNIILIKNKEIQYIGVNNTGDKNEK